MDLTTVSCDGARALVDFDVYDNGVGRVVQLRVSYTLGDSALTPEAGVPQDLLEALCKDASALADVREAVMHQRDVNRSKN